MRVGSKLK